METSSASRELPEGVTQGDLYDGPVVVPLKPAAPAPPAAASLVTPIPEVDLTPGSIEWRSGPRPPGYHPAGEVTPVADLKKSYPAVLTAALDVLNARLLGLIAVVAACAIWGFAVYDPTTQRIAAASLFSLTALLPLIVLYWKAGVTGGGG